jgi:hypothetical protein
LVLRCATVDWGKATDGMKHIQQLVFRHNICFDLRDGFATISPKAGVFSVWMMLVWLQCSCPYNLVQSATNLIYVMTVSEITHGSKGTPSGYTE